MAERDAESCDGILRFEDEAFKKLATHLLPLSAQALATAVHAGEFIKVNGDG